ncbi:hypothetical protein KVR01_013626 [Diaporthe batatas]|uniref:uncharacterized protein n=1 Tax=Diaporthe batatas TaxID=748121 RepID=UPI001D0573EC|nr:uncharacterized protein KVR01_013626 [Diaporthe batatas]KAG8156522.1 hypothetical protein KVR01_013626 [Diaporthe batatas]
MNDESAQEIPPINQDPIRNAEGAQGAKARITKYLVERVPEFATLSEIRDKGWKNAEGDRFFQNQRRQADEGSHTTQVILNNMMGRIAKEMQGATGAFKIQPTRSNTGHEPQKRILDCCMAPGTYLQAALEHNPGAHALAFSLPPEKGGHPSLLVDNNEPEVTIKLLDVTLLAADMGVAPEQIPSDHPDAAAFLPRQVEDGRHFDLVICDGQVLRTHAPHRAAYRERREARRLILTQLILGLDHLRPGGTMIVLLHKLEAWDTLCLLRTFHGFSTIQTFKPWAGHRKRSSFYMVATDIRADGPEAVSAVKAWKEDWKLATFMDEEEYQSYTERAHQDADKNVDALLTEFGREIIRLGRRVWRIQADALARAPFNRK